MKPYLFVLISLCIMPVTLAQQTKNFYDLYGRQGSITQKDEILEGQLAKEGKYTFQWREVDNHGIHTYLATGNLKNHQPEQLWIFEKGDWEYTVSSGAASIVPEFQAKGNRSQWKGNFSAGNASGKWTYMVQEVENRLVRTKPLVALEQTFKNQKLVGAFQWQFNTDQVFFTLQGNCNEAGEAHGTWVYEYKDLSGMLVKESHEYHQGLLLSVSLGRSDNIITQHWEANEAYVSAIKNDTYALGDKLFSVSEAYGLGSEYYNMLIPSVFKISWGLDTFPLEVNFPMPFFRRLIFPLQSQEQETIARSQRKIQELKQQITVHLSGDMFIERARGEQLDASVSYLNATLSRLQSIDSLLQKTNEPDFAYKNRFQQGVSHWVSKINEVTLVKGTVYESHVVHLPVLTYSSEAKQIFKAIEVLLQDTERALPVHLQIVKETTELLEKEGKLKSLEGQMSSRFIGLQAQYQNQQGIGKIIADQWIQGYLQSLIKSYAQETAYEEALALGQDILTKMSQLENIFAEIPAYDTMSQDIKSKYTSMVYNPYTGENDIPLVVKRRTHQNIQELLWPWLHQRLVQVQHFDAFMQYWRQQFHVFEAVMALAYDESASARKLNKRIRSEKRPERIFRLLLP